MTAQRGGTQTIRIIEQILLDEGIMENNNINVNVAPCSSWTSQPATASLREMLSEGVVGIGELLYDMTLLDFPMDRDAGHPALVRGAIFTI